jgi:S-adenosylmethionine decarboxylase
MKGQMLTVEAYGPHLVLDGYECDPKRLADLECIYDFLDRAPEVIGMTRIMPPYVFKFNPQPPRPPEDAGISGFVIIAESHISVHTYPERAYLSADFFSCKAFPVETAIDFLVRHFGIGRWEHRVFDRGLEYPRDLHLAKKLTMEQRIGGRAP